MELPILSEAVVVFGLSIGVIVICHLQAGIVAYLFEEHRQVRGKTPLFEQPVQESGKEPSIKKSRPGGVTS
jgi:hypothetical protein